MIRRGQAVFVQCAVAASYFLHNDGHANRVGLINLDERIGNVDAGGEDGAAKGAGGVDRIGGGGVDFLDMMARTGNRDAGWIRGHFDDLLPVGEDSGDARVNLNLATSSEYQRPGAVGWEQSA